MITKKLVNRNNMKDEDGINFSVEYYVTVDDDIFSDSEFQYGISIEKTHLNGSKDTYSAQACFKKEENALLLLKNLCEYSVTPISAEESIDILMDSCPFKY